MKLEFKHIYGAVVMGLSKIHDGNMYNRNLNDRIVIKEDDQIILYNMNSLKDKDTWKDDGQQLIVLARKFK